MTNINISKRFANYLIKRGKKEKILTVLFLGFQNIQKENKKSYQKILYLLFKKLHLRYELRNVKKRRRTIVLPIKINAKREYFHSIKSILNSINVKEERSSFLIIFLNEIVKIITNSKCAALQERNNTLKETLKHKSIIRYN